MTLVTKVSGTGSDANGNPVNGPITITTKDNGDGFNFEPRVYQNEFGQTVIDNTHQMQPPHALLVNNAVIEQRLAYVNLNTAQLATEQEAEENANVRGVMLTTVDSTPKAPEPRDEQPAEPVNTENVPMQPTNSSLENGESLPSAPNTTVGPA